MIKKIKRKVLMCILLFVTKRLDEEDVPFFAEHNPYIALKAKLDSIYPVVQIEVGVERDKLMINAGHREVINKISSYADKQHNKF